MTIEIKITMQLSAYILYATFQWDPFTSFGHVTCEKADDEYDTSIMCSFYGLRSNMREYIW